MHTVLMVFLPFEYSYLAHEEYRFTHLRRIPGTALNTNHVKLTSLLANPFLNGSHREK